ncbi:hypothetical protein P692DRAFT_201810921 [Suillus brevipes Sb2]|nr:hypothetical protein P692DRAFT_201810921 [Suillus brevipes Sb2]
MTRNIILAEFCSEIPIAHGKTTILQLMDVSSGTHSTFHTTFRQRFSLPIENEQCGNDRTCNEEEVSPSINISSPPAPVDDRVSEASYSSVDMSSASDGLHDDANQVDHANALDGVKHVNGALFLSNPLLSPPMVHSQTGEPSLYLKRFVRKTPTLVYGWFEMTGPHPISTPPSFSSFEDVQLGDLFLHRTDQKVSCWLREHSASGGIWRTIALGDKGSLNEDFASRMLALQSDGNPTWVLPKTAARYKRSTRIKLQDEGT